MNGTQDRGRVRGQVAAASIRLAMPQVRRLRVGGLLGAAIEVALIAALGGVVFLAVGIVGSPWYRIVAIEGGSMEPTISRGDLIVVAPAPAGVAPGMVLVLSVDGQVVTHRVVAITADGSVVTRGDANRADDAWESREVEVVGQYVATIPLLGSFLPVHEVSGALFADGTIGTMEIIVGPWEIPPTPDACAGLRFDEVLVGSSADDTFMTANGGALVFGLGGNDTVAGGNGKDCLVGGEGDDTLTGGNGKDVLLGGEGDDTLTGGNGKDVLLGGEGDDRLYGNRDADILEGGRGKDLLHGGAGTDVCRGTKADKFVSCESPRAGGATNPKATPDLKPSPSPSPEPKAGASPSLTPEPEASPSPQLDVSPSPQLDASPSADPGASPSPSPTPEPSTTAAPSTDAGASPSPSPAPTLDPPAADFTFSVAGLAVSFTNHATGAESWTWDFGDGAASTRRNPHHTYATGDDYTVTLQVVGADGSSASKSLEVTVAP